MGATESLPSDQPSKAERSCLPSSLQQHLGEFLPSFLLLLSEFAGPVEFHHLLRLSCYSLQTSEVPKQCWELFLQRDFKKSLRGCSTAEEEYVQWRIAWSQVRSTLAMLCSWAEAGTAETKLIDDSQQEEVLASLQLLCELCESSDATLHDTALDMTSEPHTCRSLALLVGRKKKKRITDPQRQQFAKAIDFKVVALLSACALVSPENVRIAINGTKTNQVFYNMFEAEFKRSTQRSVDVWTAACMATRLFLAIRAPRCLRSLSNMNCSSSNLFNIPQPTQYTFVLSTDQNGKQTLVVQLMIKQVPLDRPLSNEDLPKEIACVLSVSAQSLVPKSCPFTAFDHLPLMCAVGSSVPGEEAGIGCIIFTRGPHVQMYANLPLAFDGCLQAARGLPWIIGRCTQG
eukprot:TRINITY_DN40572_c0_g1_i1.p1 TRINITY_DN40572_c0_g1~~TRINITY_DN40572_c0_g1_i1.p1  ORF type:complete len:402 (+),score=48.75 TRINITY_DN40572_c0_g1_i1:64-1269(+)